MYTFRYDTPEALGIPSPALLKFLDRLEKIDFVHGIMLMRHGKVALEGMRKPFDPERPHQLFSVSKSFTSAAIGMAQREGLLKLDDKLVDYFPEYAKTAHPRLAKTCLFDLLTMRSGFSQCTARRMFAAPDGDWVKCYFSLVPEGDPGTFFTYNSGATYMLGAVLYRLTGQTLREYLTPRLFEALDIVPGIWESCPRGLNCAGWGLYLKLRDLAKFAQLLLDGGVHDGREIIPADYLAEAVKPHADNSMNTKPDWKLGYGCQFWRSTYGFRCDGAAGQYAVVVPEFDLTFTSVSATPTMQSILTALWEEVVPALSPTPLPEDRAAQADLRETLERLAMPTAGGNEAPRHLRKHFDFAPNACGIEACAVEAEKDECALTFRLSGGEMEQLRAGFGKFEYSTVKLTDSLPHPTAASAAWTDGKLVIESFILDGIFRSTYTVDFSPGVAEPITRKDICSTFRPPWETLKLR
jgi:CubicO group peptidase (beta-lactamase class C family)